MKKDGLTPLGAHLPKHPKGTNTRNLCPMTPDEAYDVFRQMENPTARGLCKVLKEDHDIKMNPNTVASWMKKYNWHERLGTKPHGATQEPETIDALLNTIKKEGKNFDHNAIDGIAARVVARICIALPTITISKPDDVAKMVEILHELNAETHHRAGTDVKATRPDSTSDDPNVLTMPMSPTLKAKKDAEARAKAAAKK